MPWGHRRYEWLYVYAFVQPSTGRVEWLLLPPPSIANSLPWRWRTLPKRSARGQTSTCLLVVDQAGWHRSWHLQVPVGIHLVPLPPYSPELQPAERLWPLLREAVAKRTVLDMDTLEDLLLHRPQLLSADRQTLQRHTRLCLVAAPRAGRTACPMNQRNQQESVYSHFG